MPVPNYQASDIRRHGAQQTNSPNAPVSGGTVPTHGSPETTTTGPIHGTNGNLYDNQVVNGSFTSGSNWTLTNATISGGTLNINSAGTVFAAVQSESFVVGATYEVSYDVSNYVAGGVNIQFGVGSNVNGIVRNANGSYTETMVAGTNNSELRVVAQGATNLSITNIVVQQIIPTPH